MSVRVVVYCEGAGERGGETRLLPAPGEMLEEEHLGPAHHLVRQVVAAVAACPPSAVVFVSPLRVRGRHARGSDLLVPKLLRQLVAFPPNPRRPNVAIVLVDQDGDSSRQGLAVHLDAAVVPSVLGLPVPEFEAWLLTDGEALLSALGGTVDVPGDPEALKPGEAKAFLQAALRASGVDSAGEQRVRGLIAQRVSFDKAKRQRSFERFVKALQACLRRS